MRIAACDGAFILVWENGWKGAVAAMRGDPVERLGSPGSRTTMSAVAGVWTISSTREVADQRWSAAI